MTARTSYKIAGPHAFALCVYCGGEAGAHAGGLLGSVSDSVSVACMRVLVLVYKYSISVVRARCAAQVDGKAQPCSAGQLVIKMTLVWSEVPPRPRPTTHTRPHAPQTPIPTPPRPFCVHRPLYVRAHR